MQYLQCSSDYYRKNHRDFLYIVRFHVILPHCRPTAQTRALYFDEQEEHEDIYESHLPTPEGSERVRDSGLYGTQRSWYQASIASSGH